MLKNMFILSLGDPGYCKIFDYFQIQDVSVILSYSRVLFKKELSMQASNLWYKVPYFELVQAASTVVVSWVMIFKFGFC